MYFSFGKFAEVISDGRTFLEVETVRKCTFHFSFEWNHSKILSMILSQTNYHPLKFIEGLPILDSVVFELSVKAVPQYYYFSRMDKMI